MRFPKVTVVVPFYNPGQFFQQCVSSIISQDYENLEILFVDDGSISGTVPNLIFKEGKIRLIEQSHLGVGAARNFGLSRATGDYVCFLDSDDFFETSFISELVRSAIDHESDVVVCGFYYYNQTKEVDERRRVPVDLFNGTLTAECLKANIFAFSPNVWNKRYSKSNKINKYLKRWGITRRFSCSDFPNNC